MTTALVTHPLFEQHRVPEGHPECPQRLARILDALRAAGVYDLLAQVEAPAATREQLERVHSPDYLDSLEQAVPDEGIAQIDPDTFMSPATLSAARHAAGAAVAAADMVLGGDARNAFCCVRPPGHHAGPATAMGFCFLNNVAVAAAHALDSDRVDRVALLDFDVHHGNGTEEIFRDDERVLLCSTYQHPFYPFTGADSVPGHIVNVPLPAGSGDRALVKAFEEILVPAAAAFHPDLVLVSAGFDWHRNDLGGNVTENGFAVLTRIMQQIAERHCPGRLAFVQEGGYDLGSLASCAHAMIATLAGREPEPVHECGVAEVEAAAAFHRDAFVADDPDG